MVWSASKKPEGLPKPELHSFTSNALFSACNAILPGLNEAIAASIFHPLNGVQKNRDMDFSVASLPNTAVERS
jgi:hypothetical protein